MVFNATFKTIFQLYRGNWITRWKPPLCHK